MSAGSALMQRARRPRRGPARWLAMLCGLLLAQAGAVRADGLADVQQRGVVRVGVKADMPTWGLRDPATGHIAGLEPDLAADLARRLGVRLELVPLETAAKVDAVVRGQVDVALATMSDTPERRAQVAMVLPHYYSSGIGVLSHRQHGFRSWDDLRHRRVCARRGSSANREITVTHGANLVPLYSNSLAMAALRDGRCDALLYEDVAIVALLSAPQWGRDYEMALPSRYVTPWAIALPLREAGGRLQAQVSLAVADWHRSGLLLALERKWGAPPSAHAVRMNAVWQRRHAGGWYCGEVVSATTPKDCL